MTSSPHRAMTYLEWSVRNTNGALRRILDDITKASQTEDGFKAQIDHIDKFSGKEGLGLHYAGYAWLSSLGDNVLVVGPHMQELFAHTTLPTLPQDWQAKLPYECFYVHLTHPGVAWDVDKRMEETGLPHRVRGGLVFSTLVDDESFKEGEKEVDEGHVSFEMIVFDPHGDDMPNVTKINIYSLPLEGNLEKGLSEYMTDKHDGDLYYDDCVQFARIVINLVLYLSSPDGPRSRVDRSAADNAGLLKAKAEGGRKRMRKHHKRQYDLASRHTVTYVGEHIEEACRNAEEPSEGHRRRHWVRGHWRYARVGPRSEMRREWVWVRPHLRGSGEPEVEGRDYRFVAESRMCKESLEEKHVPARKRTHERSHHPPAPEPHQAL